MADNRHLEKSTKNPDISKQVDRFQQNLVCYSITALSTLRAVKSTEIANKTAYVNVKTKDNP